MYRTLINMKSVFRVHGLHGLLTWQRCLVKYSNWDRNVHCVWTYPDACVWHNISDCIHVV